MRDALFRLAGFGFVLLTACGGNQYSYSRTYEPLSDEETWLEQAAEVSYEEARRDPEGHRRQLLSWFGVVQAVKPVDDGRHLVEMNLRFHQPRPLCADHSDKSCRVTVSEKRRGQFSARVHLRVDDTTGRRRVGPGSLVRVYGKVSGDFDKMGGPILEAEYYRQWPHGTYVTTGARAAMRR